MNAVADRPGHPPFDDLQPTVEWQVNGRCNYDCSYCIQSPARRTGAPSVERVHAIVDTFSSLPGRWEIKMSGGEPFAFAGLMSDVIPALMGRTSHRISILTNLSAPLPHLLRFAEMTAGRLGIVSASVHLEHVDASAWIEKAKALDEARRHHSPQSSLVVNSVLVPGRLRPLLELKAKLESAGLRYFPQLMKIKGGVFPYSARDRALVEALCERSVDPQQVNRAPSYKGLHCEAGAWYFVVDQQGDAWSCRTAKRFDTAEDRDAWLGNLADGSFQLRTQGGACEFPICPCTVPANRGIVRDIPSRSGATP